MPLLHPHTQKVQKCLWPPELEDIPEDEEPEKPR